MNNVHPADDLLSAEKENGLNEMDITVRPALRGFLHLHDVSIQKPLS